MINELKSNQFEQVRSLFRDLNYHLAIFSVIEGNSPGRIWADHPRHPQTALVWDKAEGGFYLAGFEGDDGLNQALNDCIRQQIYPAARRLPRMLDFVLNYFPETWEDKLDVVLRDTAPMKHYRQHFTFKQLKVDWKSQLPEGFVMTRVDEALLSGTGLKNIDHVSRWVLGSWQSVDNFMDKGFGFCLLHGAVIASWSVADYVAGKAYEIGIHTDEDYRRRGLATLTVAAAVEHCLARGATEIGWHCWSSNVASAATARKVGFEQTIEHPVYHAWYNRFDNLLVQGWFNLGQYQRYDAAAQAYEAAFALRDSGDEDALASHLYTDDEGTERWCHYNAACAWALVGDSQAAFRNLNKAIERGWHDIDFLERDERLKSLHETEGWRSLISHLSQLKKEKS
jgi:RimJ/RimL family protein N-acetyltransferase